MTEVLPPLSLLTPARVGRTRGSELHAIASFLFSYNEVHGRTSPVTPLTIATHQCRPAMIPSRPATYVTVRVGVTILAVA